MAKKNTSLETYNQKRDFTKTAEPSGETAATDGLLKFVIQRHAASHLHYDFRLEMEGVLKSWAVPKGPSLNPGDKRLAMMVEDHPYAYRTFEGSIPEGSYGGGEVEIWDAGTYEPLEKVKGKSDDLTMRSELHKGSLKFILHGEKLQGEFALVKIKSSTDGKSWLLIKHKDEFATTEDYNAEDYTDENSKVTQRVKEKFPDRLSSRYSEKNEVKTEPKAIIKTKAKFIKPMLAKAGGGPFDDEDWAFEIKWDGYRAVADLRDQIQLYSRNGLDFSDKFRKIANQLQLQDHQMVLDGEIVALNDNDKPDFQLIQNIAENPGAKLVYQVFDILWLNGHSTENLTYLQRKELLKGALKNTDLVKYHDHVIGEGKAFFDAACKAGLEGMIAKKTDSIYTEGGRTSEWLKVKVQPTDEVIICGFTEPKGSRKFFGSLILGTYIDGELSFCGHTGTGFPDKLLKQLYAEMQPLVTDKMPFSKKPKTNSPSTWLKPDLVAEIKFTEITQDHIYRHPVFLHLREDKTVEDLRISSAKDKKPTEESVPEMKPISKIKKNSEKPAPADNEGKVKLGKQEVKLTNQSKIYFPKNNITKGDVIAYYQSVAEYILPYLKDRPQSLNRFPNGVDGMSFYQKDASGDTPDWVRTEAIYSESNEKDIQYIICDDRATLAYLNNLGCIEMNVWTSRARHLEKPDYLVLDLDPSDNNTFEDVIETAQVVRQVLDRAGVTAYPKTSGSTGIHIYVPMGAKYDFDQVKNFAHLLMQLVNRELPAITTIERSLQKRDKGKIYLDYLQNRRGQTLASVYSLRPKADATVSVPLEWEEVKPGLKPTDFNIENTLERIKLKGDLFEPVLQKGADILKALKKLQ